MSTGHYTVSLVEGLRAAGFTVNEQLLKTYSQYLRQANAQLFPHGKPAFTLAPPARPEEMKLSDSVLTQSARDADVAVFTIGRKSGEATDRPKTDFYLTAAERRVCICCHRASTKLARRWWYCLTSVVLWM